MRTAVFIFTIAAIAVVYSTGAFILDTNGVADTFAGLPVLNDAEMAQRIGGPWTHEIASEPSGDYASCSISNCPDNTYIWTHARYRCVPCNDSSQSAFKSVVMPKVTTSWCDDYGVEGIRCTFELATADWHYSCIFFQGPCN